MCLCDFGRSEKDECDLFLFFLGGWGGGVVVLSEKDVCACVLFAGLRTDECGCDQ